MPPNATQITFQVNGKPVVIGLDKVRKALRDVDRATSKVKKRFLGLQRPTLILSRRFGVLRLAALGVTGALVGMTVVAIGVSIRKSISAFLTFSKTMLQVKAVTQSTEAGFKRLKDTALKLGETTAFTALEVAGAMVVLGRAGQDVNEIIKVLPATLNLAAATATNLTTVTQILSDIMGQFDIPLSKATETADLLTAATIKSKTKLGELAQTFKFSAPLAKALGLDIKDLAALMAAMAEGGIRAGMGGRALRMVLTRLVDPSDKLIKVFDDLRIELFDTNGQIRKMKDLFGDLARRGIKPAQVEILGGKRAISGLIIAFRRGGKFIREFRDEFEKVGNTAERVAGVQLSGAQGDVVRMNSAIESASITIGESFAPVITILADAAAEAARVFRSWLPILKQLLAGFFLPLQLAILSVVTFVRTSLRGIAFALGALVKVAIPIVLPLFNFLSKGFIDLQILIKSIFGKVVRFLKNTFADLLNIVKSVLFKVAETAKFIGATTIAKNLDAAAVALSQFARKTKKSLEDPAEAAKKLNEEREALLEGLKKFNKFVKTIPGGLKAFSDALDGTDQFSETLERTLASLFKTMMGFSDATNEAAGSFDKLGKKLTEVERTAAALRGKRKVRGIDIIGERPFRDPRQTIAARQKRIQEELRKEEELRKAALKKIPAGIFRDIFEEMEAPAPAIEGFLLRMQTLADSLGVSLLQLGQIGQVVFEGLANTLSAASGAIVGGFIDMAIAGKISGKALAKATLEAASGALKGLAIQAASEAAFAVAKGLVAVAITGNPVAGAKFFAAAKAFALVSGGAALGAIATGRAAAAIKVPTREQVAVGFGPGGVVTGRGARGFGVSDVPQQRRGRGDLNVQITVEGFVGDEGALASKIGEIIREGVFDDVDFALNVRR